jgi:adenosine deaminase
MRTRNLYAIRTRNIFINNDLQPSESEHPTYMTTSISKLSKSEVIQLPKILIHEHLDCSVRHFTLLDLMDQAGIFPASMPNEILNRWLGSAVDKLLPPADYDAARQASREQAAVEYGKWISSFAGQSLKNYVSAIVEHILPVMQTSENLYRITKERIEDAIKDGIIAFELRFAPQLHTLGAPAGNGNNTGAKNPLSLDEVMEAVIRAVKESPIPMKLCVCALRHENDSTAKELANLAIKYREFVGVFDLAADEAANPGVLDWWLPEALRVRKEAGILLTCHLWETNEPTDEDLRKLEEHGIQRLGHGVRGRRQGARTLELCPTSNVVTGQYESFALHPIDQLFRSNMSVTVNTDGLTFCFTVVEGLSEEYFNLQETFGWGLKEFYAVNANGVAASCFDSSTKEDLLRKLRHSYLGE